MYSNHNFNRWRRHPWHGLRARRDDAPERHHHRIGDLHQELAERIVEICANNLQQQSQQDRRHVEVDQSSDQVGKSLVC